MKSRSKELARKRFNSSRISGGSCRISQRNGNPSHSGFRELPSFVLFSYLFFFTSGSRSFCMIYPEGWRRFFSEGKPRYAKTTNEKREITRKAKRMRKGPETFLPTKQTACRELQKVVKTQVDEEWRGPPPRIPGEESFVPETQSLEKKQERKKNV